MKKAILLLLVLFACTTPKEREEDVKELGKLVFRTLPITIGATTEIFILKKDGNFHLVDHESVYLLPSLCEEK